MINLNLLSTKEKDRIKLKKNFLLTKNVIFVISLALIIIIISLLSTRIILNIYAKDFEKTLENEKNLLSTTKRASLEKSTKELNTQLNMISYIQKEYVKWSKILIDSAKVVPNGVKINSLELNKNNKKVTILGLAKNREVLLEFQNNLKNLNYFANITSPLSNLLTKENIEFQFTGELSQEIYSK